MLLCNDAQIEKSRVGDPTELALLDFGARYGFEKNALGTSFERKKENAFDSDRENDVRALPGTGKADMVC